MRIRLVKIQPELEFRYGFELGRRYVALKHPSHSGYDLLISNHTLWDCGLYYYALHELIL